MLVNNPTLKEQYYIQGNLDSWFETDIYPLSELHTFEKGEFLCFEGKPVHDVFFLVKGKVKNFCTHSNGKVSLIEFNTPLSIIGEMELIGTRKETIAVQAMEPCVCIAFPVRKCADFLLKDPVFLLNLARYLSLRTKTDTRHFVTNQAHSLEERFCGFVLKVQVNGYFGEKLTETSEYLGCSYRHMQRVVEQLCHDGILTRTRKGYKINDFAYLQKHNDNLQ